MAAIPALASATGTATLGALPSPAANVTGDINAKARATAVDFETVFLSSMFGQMFTAIGSEGPLGDSAGVGVWRSFLTEEYAKSFAKSGGIGLADQVYRTLIAQQEARAN
jgi:Rod binding domain-containing protein